jgi:hypothetical protein
MTHRKNRRQENAILSEDNPLGLWGVKSIGEKRMTISVMHEYHHRTPALKLGLLCFIQKNQSPTPKRDDN